MADNIENNGKITQIIDVSALVSANRNMREYLKTGNVYLKTIISNLNQIYSQLSKPTLRAEPSPIKVPQLSKVDVNYQKAERQEVSGISEVTSAIGGLIGYAGGSLGSAIGSTIGLVVGNFFESKASERETESADKEKAFKDEVNQRYSDVQNTKNDSIQSGSEMAMQKEYAAADARRVEKFRAEQFVRYEIKTVAKRGPAGPLFVIRREKWTGQQLW